MWAVSVASTGTASTLGEGGCNMQVQLEVGAAAHLFGASLVPVWGPGHQRVKQDRLQKAAQGGGMSPGNSHDMLTAPAEGSLHIGRTQRCLHGC